MLVSGSGDRDNIRVTIRNEGKLMIRRLELSCTPLYSRSRPAKSSPCREDNAMFYPGMEYTVSYAYPEGRAEPVKVTIKSIMTSDGFVWKPSKGQTCRVLEITPIPKRK